MQIKVKLFATLREGREREQIMDVASDITPSDIIKKLNIPLEDVAILFVNGRNGLMDQHLNDGDTLSIFPPVGGG
ncbi:MoaD/ThiS family protein [Perlabentimonas gracilis]|uniref:MoaD/ThiS family protein n=1 Tax=Perlabentimonas gracilis TaxID=2715279 RepID=UPI00140776CE|nr:MoaD/ThiS family protein [Perlabentimonas gracilis]NHB67470.1 MoaD/ThiS family protein [Perlabentimonas gracilis]